MYINKIKITTILITLIVSNISNISYAKSKKNNNKNINKENIATENNENNSENQNNIKELSIDDYLREIIDNNPYYQAQKQQEENAINLAARSELLTSFNLFSSAKTGFYEQNQAAQIFRYDRYYNQNYQIGVSNSSSLGFDSKIYYSLNKINYKDFDTSRFPNPDLAKRNFQTNPVIELNIPLIRNFLGKAIKANQKLIISEQQVNKLTAQQLSQNTIIEAYKAYYNLFFSREKLKITKNALKQAQNIYDNAKKKLAMNLGENADLLQAKAMVEQKNLELQQNQNLIAEYSRQFNKIRYCEADKTIPIIGRIDFDELVKFNLPNHINNSLIATKIAKAKMENAIANNEIIIENNKANLAINSYYAFKGVEGSINSAISSSSDPRGREGAIGLNLSLSLNNDAVNKIKSASQSNSKIAKNLYHYQEFLEDRSWLDLVSNLKNLQKSLVLAKSIENAQKLKLENEKILLNQGRSTTYQILLFQQEYLMSQLNTIEIAKQINNIIIDSKLYQENDKIIK